MDRVTGVTVCATSSPPRSDISLFLHIELQVVFIRMWSERESREVWCKTIQVKLGTGLFLSPVGGGVPGASEWPACDQGGEREAEAQEWRVGTGAGPNQPGADGGSGAAESAAGAVHAASRGQGDVRCSSFVHHDSCTDEQLLSNFNSCCLTSCGYKHMFLLQTTVINAFYPIFMSRCWPCSKLHLFVLLAH